MNNAQLNLNTFNELKALLEDEFADFLNTFLENTENELITIEQGILKSNFSQIAHAAHKLKSSASCIGAIQLQALSIQLEDESNKNTVDNIDDVYNQAHAAFIELKNQLDN